MKKASGLSLFLFIALLFIGLVFAGAVRAVDPSSGYREADSRADGSSRGHGFLC